MKVTVSVKPNSRIESVEAMADGSLLIRVNAAPVDGRANDRVIELLSEHFKKPKSSFSLIRGHKSKKKIFEVS